MLRRRGFFERTRGFRFHHLRCRFRRTFPAAFLVLASLALLGGLLNAPTGYDGLAYRTPRVLYWLSEGHWHWIHTSFHRLNTRMCGYEWVAAPLVLFMRTDRFLFLIDAIWFLLLPGLFFSVLVRLGVARRAAWYWMWVLPSGYCYVLQAGSIGNDMFGGVFALAALDLGLRARASRSLGDLWLSMLAVALLTSSKASNIPLALPWLIAVFPVLSQLLKRPVVSVAVAGVAVLASFVPMAALNYVNCGDWTGEAAEHATIGHGDALLHIGHNILVLFTENLVPPIFPMASAWNHAMLRLIPPALSHRMALSFDTSEAELRLPEMQVEEFAGVGCGLALLLGASWLAALRHKPRSLLPLAESSKERLWLMAILISGWISIVPFLIKAAWATTSRLSTPYYGLLIPALLIGSAHGTLVRRAWWRRMALGVMGLAALMVVISPARPLWPAQTVLTQAKNIYHGPLWARAWSVYSVYAGRADGFAAVRPWMTPDDQTVGLVTWDDPESSLWRPFGSRRFRHVIGEDSKADLDKLGIKHVLVSEDKFSRVFQETFEQWLGRIDGKVVARTALTLRAAGGPVDWLWVELGSRTNPPGVMVKQASGELIAGGSVGADRQPASERIQ